MKWLLALLFFASPVSADGLHLDDVGIEFRRMDNGARHPLLLPVSRHTGTLNLDLNMSLWDVIGFDNQIQSMTDQYQFAMVGWQYKIFVRITDQVSVGRYHQSQHLLDRTPARGYPLEDAWYIRIDVLKTAHKQSLF